MLFVNPVVTVDFKFTKWAVLPPAVSPAHPPIRSPWLPEIILLSCLNMGYRCSRQICRVANTEWTHTMAKVANYR